MEGPLVPINPEMLDSMKTILLLDDHAMVREAFAAVIRERMPHARLLLMPTSVQALILMSRIASIDVIVTDYHMPGIEGAELLRRIAAERPDVPIVVMCSTCRQADVDDAFACGAAAVIHQSSTGSVFIDTLRRVLAGERCISAGDWDAPPADRGALCAECGMALLTPRQAEVLTLVGEGLRFSEIATRLSTSETSIKMHVSAMLRLLAVSNRTRPASVRHAAHRFGAAHPIGGVS
ncbi:hypothetical protein U875_18860 [Pandoraea pnomenusa 3kgm]|nr:hypothetical protein U875_18860 [Pandoraea pnomenusa 3kgm]